MKIADPNAANPAAILNRDLSGIEDRLMNAPDMASIIVAITSRALEPSVYFAHLLSRL